jgi:hypothetical protein
MRFHFVATVLWTVLCLSACSTPSRSTVHYSPPSFAPAHEQITKAQVSNDTAIKVAAAIKTAIAAGDLHAANQGLDKLTNELVNVQDALKTAQLRISELELKVGVQTTDLNTCGDDKNKLLDQKAAAEAKSAKDEKKYHRLKFAVCGLLAAAATFIAVRLGIFRMLAFLGPYGAIGIAAIPAGVFAAVWFLI